MKPQFKPEEIYLDLSKLSEEQQRKVISLLPPKKWDIQYEIQKVHFILYLDEKKQWWVFGTEIKDKTELSYTQFLEMMGESEEVLQVENDWIKISDDNKPKFDLITEYWLYDGKEVWSDIFTLRMKMGNHKVTHYKEKELKPSPPKY